MTRFTAWSGASTDLRNLQLAFSDVEQALAVLETALRGAMAVGLARARAALVERVTSEPVR